RVKDPELRAKLTPDYKPGCKRIVFANEYYDAIQDPKAYLETGGIDAVEPGGIRTKDGTFHELDVLVLATGYLSDRFMRPIEMVGEEGVTLDDLWHQAPYAYRSIALPGFPNFFMVAGPNGPFGNLSYIATAESQVRYFMKVVDKIRAERVAIAPTVEATEKLGAEMREAFKNTVWTSGCNSWYLNAEGFPALYPWREARFHTEMKKAPDYRDFEIKALADAADTSFPAAAE
ncbi:MAG: NAD(P)/FAD-dependent oxidoreductase, partial [Pseudomonadota bacterium]